MEKRGDSDKKIKILQFPVANSQGGITKYVLQNWKFIDKTRFQFDFATMSKSLDFAEDLYKDGCKIHYISCYAEQDKNKFVNEFRKILEEGHYDIVHLHTKQWKSFLVEQIAKEVGVKKVVIHAHSSGVDALDDTKRKEEEELHKSVLNNLTEETATDFWACSSEAADFIFGDKISRAKVVIMNNAIDLSKYTYNDAVRNQYRKALGISEDEFVIGNVGRFVYQKNQEFLLKVFYGISAEAKNSKFKCKLLLVGSGEREEEYKKMVCDYGLESSVIFTGYRKDIPELLQAMDVFCLPSRFEGLAIGLVEAQAAGLPCVINQDVAGIGGAVQLPLDVSMWKIWLINNMDKIKRTDNIKKLTDAGYSIHYQIKILEKSYMKGLIIE